MRIQQKQSKDKVIIVRKMIILIFILIIAVASILIGLRLGKNNDSTKEGSGVPKITSFVMENRTILNKQNDIYVGNNTKELENGFYDIKISNLSQGINIYLNKLWYESSDDDYIQEDYLAKICRVVASQMMDVTQTEEFEYVLYKYIKDNYMKIRKQEDVQVMLLDNINMKFELEDNIVKLVIRSNG